MSSKAKRQPISTHLNELRRRATWVICSLALGSSVAYQLRERILQWLLAPLHEPVFYSSPAGGFQFLLQVCLFVGFIVSIPVLLYQLLQFISPAFPAKLFNKTIVIITAASFLVIIGIGFGYYFGLPAALHLLAQFGTGQVKSLISTDAYFSFVIVYLVGFVLIFQLPIVIILLNYIKPIKPVSMLHLFPYITVISFIIAAVITPTPDPFNQTLMALPMILLYLLSAGFVWFINRSSKIS